MASPEKLNSPPWSIPVLGGVEDGHSHRGIRDEIPTVKRSGVRQEIQLEVRRVCEERGVDVRAVLPGYRRNRAELVAREDSDQARPDSPLGDVGPRPPDDHLFRHRNWA